MTKETYPSTILTQQGNANTHAASTPAPPLAQRKPSLASKVVDTWACTTLRLLRDMETFVEDLAIETVLDFIRMVNRNMAGLTWTVICRDLYQEVNEWVPLRRGIQ